MKKFTLPFLCLLFMTLKAQSQIDDSSFLNRLEFKIGYSGNLLFDNGLNIGAEYKWKEKEKIKEKKKGQKVITHQFLFNGSIGYSTNFTNQTDNGLHTYYGLIWRRTNPKRWQVSVALNPLGYYRSLLPETFEVIGGQASEVKFPGRSYFAPSFSIGIGRRRNKKKYSGWYLNLNHTRRAPYNGGALPNFSIQFGCRFNLKNK